MASGGELVISVESKRLGFVGTDGIDDDGGAGILLITLAGLNGFKPAPRHPPNTFDGLKALSLPLAYAKSQSLFLTRTTPAWMRGSISAEAYVFKGSNSPTSSDRSRCEV